MNRYSLIDIKDYVLKLGELIAEVLKVDVEILDKLLNRVAGTGKHDNLTGKGLDGECLIYKRVIDTGKKLVLENPGFHKFCTDCRRRHYCPEKFQCCTPVVVDKEVIGVIALISYTDEQKKIILAKLKEYTDFLDRMSELIASKAKENYDELHKERLIKNAAYDNSVVKLDSIIGRSSEIIELKQKVKNIADGYANVLLTGESGTGKELFARAIHFESKRSHMPFIAVNCGAIPETLLESELFGYANGAFTGASKGGKIGKFELASGGTIFLDEIGDMPLMLQVKLLRVLQDRVVIPVGSNKAVRVEVRVVTATNKRLEELVGEGRFREDLFYRINVIPIRIPPLRERKEDIELLMEVLLKKYCIIYEIPVPKVSAEIIQLFKTYQWNGNVRELENTVEYIVNMLGSDTEVSRKNLPPKLVEEHKSLAEEEELKLESIEKKTIIKALKRYGLNTEDKRKAAEALGISLASLYRKINSYGIDSYNL
ncbi:sigma 54-interacting transcriptional regulator [Clostridium swellfunianum]|uniref:sigma-54 interaction domain-containing protein n=1 Tax=Clostridium swellfunianum TaxID=1367462 RepID=UPI00202DC3A5|nr:sigma 54-interacting transcriptional regulator [Clostridium swellfunianum]MCM0647540.1 sigma 54-interacting transcriptional regulator [Clostridium swellfunianum]